MPHTVITGASAGIGLALARQLADRGHALSLGARRVERIAGIAGTAFCAHLDVTDEASVEAFVQGARNAHGPIDVLVNNAGLARGVEPVAAADGRAWREMIETNVFGVLHLTRRVLPEMVERGQGHVVMLGSIAAHETYEGGSVYCASKRAVRSIAEAIRYETLGRNVRVTSVDPGMVETEFSEVRFAGDHERAAAVYADTRPLTADDIADCIVFALERPAHVNLDTIIVMPTDQASPKRLFRRR
jgi:NADP-dependent 3-hydroxy acid dehydrogenase YdfG